MMSTINTAAIFPILVLLILTWSVLKNEASDVWHVGLFQPVHHSVVLYHVERNAYIEIYGNSMSSSLKRPLQRTYAFSFPHICTCVLPSTLREVLIKLEICYRQGYCTSRKRNGKGFTNEWKLKIWRRWKMSSC